MKRGNDLQPSPLYLRFLEQVNALEKNLNLEQPMGKKKQKLYGNRMETPKVHWTFRLNVII